MTLSITDSVMTSTATDHQAAKVTREGVWSCTWCPGLQLDRNQAVSAVTLAEFIESGTAEGSKHWPLVRSLAGELGMTAQEAVAKVIKTKAD